MDGRIKSRACANNRKQWTYIKREDSASPTVSLEDFMITSSIEAHGVRDLDTIYRSGDY